MCAELSHVIAVCVFSAVLLCCQAHPDRNQPPRTDHLCMPFLFPAPSVAAAAAAAAASATAAASSSSSSSATPAAPVAPVHSATAGADDDDGPLGGMFE